MTGIVAHTYPEWWLKLAGQVAHWSTDYSVETGVRLVHIPTGITVTSTAERSQLLNKKDALEKLAVILKSKQSEQAQLQINSAWREHNKIVRGNPVRTYRGQAFQRKR